MCCCAASVRADGGILLVPVPLSALFIVRQPLLAVPCGQVRRLSPIVTLFLFRKRIDQRQYLFTHYDQSLHLSQRGFFPCFQVVVQLLHLIICCSHCQRIWYSTLRRFFLPRLDIFVPLLFLPELSSTRLYPAIRLICADCQTLLDHPNSPRHAASVTIPILLCSTETPHNPSFVMRSFC